MKSAARSVALTVLLALLAGIVGVWIGHTVLVKLNAPEPSLHQFVHRELDLSAEQERALAAEEKRFEGRRKALEAEVKRANVELAAAMRQGHSYNPAVQRAVDHFHAAMGELQKETIVHVFAMRACLTPEQAVIYDKRVGEALTEDAP